MNNLRVLIVDDELQSRSLIKRLLSIYYPTFIVEEAETVMSAVEKVQQFNPDMVFLDVQMRGETGFDLLHAVGSPQFSIIFTTAHSEFALMAFRYSALDYLMKPIDTEEFKKAVEKAVALIRGKQLQVEQIRFLKELKPNQGRPEKLVVPTGEGFLFVEVADIIYCKASGNYTEFFLLNRQKIVSSYTLGYYDSILSGNNFFRVHRSYLVNLQHVKMYKKGDGGSLIMNNGDEIEVSRANKESFLNTLKL
jgi:two-component system LytT family response regulator